MEKHDITTIEDIQLMVNTFYKKAQVDDLLGPVFNAKIQDWDKHLNIMYGFWQSVLLRQPSYHGAPFAKHISLPIQRGHFTRWVELFSANVDELFEGEVAADAKERAKQLGLIFAHKLEFMQGQSQGE